MIAWPLTANVSAPALWGKLPSSAEFLHHALPADQKQQWLSWFQQQTLIAPTLINKESLSGEQAFNKYLPVSFYFPMRTLHAEQKAPITGVIAWSHDKVGREHPIIMSQSLTMAWLQKHNLLESRKNWLFWYSRVLLHFLSLPQRLAPNTLDVNTPINLHWPDLVSATQDLWSLFSGNAGGTHTSNEASNRLELDCLKIIMRLSSDRGLSACNQLQNGVAVFPLAKLQRIDASVQDPVFWRQDASGNYTAASRNIIDLWQNSQPQGSQA
jgi:type VI secretion system protein ImpM